MAPSGNSSHTHLHALLLLGLFCLAVLLLSSSLTSYDRLINEVNNFGHILLFGCVATGILLWVKTTQRKRFGNPATQYAVAISVAVGLAAITEGLQVFSSRSADIIDLLRNILGIGVFIGCYALFDRRLPRLERLSHRTKALCLIILSIVPALAFLPVVKAATIEYRISAQLPALFNFDEAWEFELIRPLNAKIYPNDKSSAQGGAIAEFSANKFASLLFNDFKRDWNDYTTLRIELESEAPQAETLGLLVFDRVYKYEWEDGYRRDVVLQPGSNSIEIALREIERGAQTRQLGLCCMQAIELFRNRNPRPLSLKIKRIMLE